MISTGAEALDGRLGRLRRGGLYVFHGPGAAGKSVVGLHFLMDGLERGERCMLITRDEPAMIDSRALFVGWNAGRITEHPNLVIAKIPAVLPTGHGLTPGQAFVEWLSALTGGVHPTRIVLDSVAWLAQYSSAPVPLLHELRRFLNAQEAAAFALVRTPPGEPLNAAVYQPLLHDAEGVFELEIAERGERRFHFRVAPKDAFRADSFSYSLRAGGGFSEEHALNEVELSDAERQRVIVVDHGVIASDTYAALEAAFELVRLPSAAAGLTTLFEARYGMLVMAVDAYEETRTFDVAFELRREGHPAPIVFIAPGHGLRSGTRARGLRAGGDDFVVSDMPTDALMERMHAVWTRGSHSRNGLSQTALIAQPVGDNGLHRPMTEDEFRQALETLMGVQPPLFFCYVEMSIEAAPSAVWPEIRRQIRVGQGDLVGFLPGNRIALVLDRITREQTDRVIQRLRQASPILRTVRSVSVLTSPLQADELSGRAGLFRPQSLAASS